MNHSDINVILGIIGAVTGVLGLALAVIGIALAGAATTAIVITGFLIGDALGRAVGAWVARRLRTPP
jgi:hypothetical protein